jgi:hypothetical protein
LEAEAGVKPRSPKGRAQRAGLLAQALGGLEIDQVFALDALVFGIVLAHVSDLMP